MRSDVELHALDGLLERLAVDLFGPTERGRMSARAEAASLHDDAERSIASHLAHVRESRAKLEQEIPDLEAKVKALEARRDGSHAIAAAPQPSRRDGTGRPGGTGRHVDGQIQLLGVR